MAEVIVTATSEAEKLKAQKLASVNTQRAHEKVHNKKKTEDLRKAQGESQGQAGR